MNANRIFSKDEEAVSPVIGVILMVAITVILAAVIAAFVFGMGGNLTEAPPSVSLVASSNSATSGADIIIKHTGGDVLAGSDWKVSVVAAGNNTGYVTSSSVDDFSVGSQVIIENDETITTTAPYTFSTTWKHNGGGDEFVQGNKYDVKVVHIPSNSMVLDTVVIIR